MSPRFGIVGRKNSGKTTLVCRLVEEFVRRGVRVSTVKHASSAVRIDHEGTDSFAHRMAGAGEVALVGAARWGIIGELRGEPEPSLDDIVARMSPAALILIEGFKTAPHQKIEVRAGGVPLDRSIVPNIVAVADDEGPLRRDDVAGIADVIVRTLGLKVSVAA